MDVTEIRQANVGMLVTAAGGPTEFGKRIERDQAQVSQWLSPTNPKPIGGRLARYIESRIGRDKGWLDRPQWEGASQSAPSNDSQLVRLDQEIVEATHKALKDMYRVKNRVYHEQDVARFVIVYEKLAARKAGATEAELFGAGLSGDQEGEAGGRDAGMPSKGANTGTVARRVRR